jgi:hypothetical protein
MANTTPIISKGAPNHFKTGRATSIATIPSRRTPSATAVTAIFVDVSSAMAVKMITAAMPIRCNDDREGKAKHGNVQWQRFSFSFLVRLELFENRLERKHVEDQTSSERQHTERNAIIVKVPFADQSRHRKSKAREDRGSDS